MKNPLLIAAACLFVAMVMLVTLIVEAAMES
jgi:hypothetical protein